MSSISKPRSSIRCSIIHSTAYCRSKPTVPTVRAEDTRVPAVYPALAPAPGRSSKPRCRLPRALQPSQPRLVFTPSLQNRSTSCSLASRGHSTSPTRGNARYVPATSRTRTLRTMDPIRTAVWRQGGVSGTCSLRLIGRGVATSETRFRGHLGHLGHLVGWRWALWLANERGEANQARFETTSTVTLAGPFGRAAFLAPCA